MAGENMVIKMDKSKTIQPKKIYKARPVPHHWQEEGKLLIDSLIKDGIIKEVHVETTDWVSPAFFVPKSNGRIHLVTDFTHLNCWIKKPIHTFPSAKTSWLTYDTAQHTSPSLTPSRDIIKFPSPMNQRTSPLSFYPGANIDTAEAQ